MENNGVAQSQNTNNNNLEQDKLNVAANNLQFGEEIRRMLATAGTLDTTEEQNEILFGPFQDKDIYLKPDGLIYISWTKYASRLTKAFGASWTILPQGMPKVTDKKLVVWGFHLIIKGVYCGFSIGEQQYFENDRMTFGEACEGAKSNALTRLCKTFGIGNELWDKEFKQLWIEKYANKVWVNGENGAKGKYVYSLKPDAFKNAPIKTADNANTIVPVANNNNNNTATPFKTTTTITTATPAVIIEKAPAPEINSERNNSAPIEPIMEIKTESSTELNKTKLEKTVAKSENKKNNQTVATTPNTENKKESRLPENNDFLNNKSTATIPLEKIPESEVTGKKSAKFHELDKRLDESKTIEELNKAYNIDAKASHSSGQINDDEKEMLRVKANELYNILIKK